MKPYIVHFNTFNLTMFVLFHHKSLTHTIPSGGGVLSLEYQFCMRALYARTVLTHSSQLAAYYSLFTKLRTATSEKYKTINIFYPHSLWSFSFHVTLSFAVLCTQTIKMKSKEVKYFLSMYESIYVKQGRIQKQMRIDLCY